MRLRTASLAVPASTYFPPTPDPATARRHARDLPRAVVYLRVDERVPTDVEIAMRILVTMTRHMHRAVFGTRFTLPHDAFASTET